MTHEERAKQTISKLVGIETPWEVAVRECAARLRAEAKLADAEDLLEAVQALDREDGLYGINSKIAAYFAISGAGGGEDGIE